jgi:hypothetical protein
LDGPALLRQGTGRDRRLSYGEPANWDERAPAHAASPDYGIQRYVDDPEHLSDVVRFDRPRLGDVTGLRAVHLQCHIGTDTLSLHRLGARMTGLDLTMLQEHDSAPWNALPGVTECDERGEWRLRDRPWRLPMSYTLQARKRS